MDVQNKKKIINDPVYGFINIPNEELFDIVQSSFVQRLRRIKQLGLSNLVYPGAEHSRFSHSLGAMHLMVQALEVLRQKGVEITESEYNGALIAILLHDVGHSPFSHCLEHFFFDCSHEDLSYLFMQKLSVSETARQIFAGTYPKQFLHQLVSSQVDTDRLDYLTRDSFFTGVSEGVIGTERILKMFNVWGGELMVDEKGVYSIEKFIISRRLMYWQVYMHKTVVAADNLMKNILMRARDLQTEGRLHTELYPVSSHLAYFLSNGMRTKQDAQAVEHFVLLDDSDIWSSIKTWTLHPDKILSFLSQSLVNRRLGKIIIQNEPFSQEQMRRLCRYESSEEQRYFTATDQLHNKAYNFLDTGINILYKDGSVREICEASDQLDRGFLSKEIKKYFFYQI
ncbi:MAG: HD domain-containing protein [Bacteroidales bacterium]|nr:HD domain-containing protein [Bacteroidales bacterium]